MKAGVKANIYACNEFVASIPSIAVGDNLWMAIDRLQGTTYQHFKERIGFLIRTRFGVEYLPDIHQGFNDWGLEFLWYPTQPSTAGTPDYHSWTGHVLARQVDVELTSRRYGQSLWRVPAEWQTMTDMAYIQSISEQFETMKRKWGFK